MDWDYLFPSGWKARDMQAAISRVFSRIPGTDAPSMDGKRYYQQGFNVLASGLRAAGWSQVTANSAPDRKNRTFSNAPFMFSGGERGGPLATYLTSAKKRSNFNLWLNTAVKRVIREGGHITGVEVEPFRTGGYQGIVNVTNISGRVVLSAGTFGSAKILLRSGIGPKDQLEVVKNSQTDGPTMISNSSWIPLPVGYNLDDHLNVGGRGQAKHPRLCVLRIAFRRTLSSPTPTLPSMTSTPPGRPRSSRTRTATSVCRSLTPCIPPIRKGGS